METLVALLNRLKRIFAQLFDWGQRVTGLSRYTYTVQSVSDPSIFYLYREAKGQRGSGVNGQYLSVAGDWIDGNPYWTGYPDQEEFETRHPLTFQDADRAESQARNLNIGIPQRWPIFAAGIAIAGVVATWINAFGSSGVCP